jgi:hypothetical protein
MVSNTKQRKGLDGDFGRETPSATGTTAKIHTWFAGWHLDDGFSVPETDKFVDTLRKLKWTATDIRELSVEELLHDLHACGYTFKWAPRLAGDIQRAITLKVSLIHWTQLLFGSNSTSRSNSRVLWIILPELLIFSRISLVFVL